MCVTNYGSVAITVQDNRPYWTAADTETTAGADVYLDNWNAIRPELDGIDRTDLAIGYVACFDWTHRFDLLRRESQAGSINTSKTPEATTLGSDRDSRRLRCGTARLSNRDRLPWHSWQVPSRPVEA